MEIPKLTAKEVRSMYLLQVPAAAMSSYKLADGLVNDKPVSNPFSRLNTRLLSEVSVAALIAPHLGYIFAQIVNILT